MTEEITLEKFTVMRIQLKKLKNSELQFRRIYEDHVETLKGTMTMKRTDGTYVGNIEPVVVRPLDKAAVPHSYEILAGYHRVEAARKAGMNHIECKVIRCEEEDAFDIALTTNLARKDLTDYETAMAIKFSMDKFNRKLTQTAARIGITKSHASNLVRCLTQSSEFVLIKWSEGELSTGHVKMLIQLENVEDQTKYAEKIITGNWSVRAIEGIIKNVSMREKAVEQLDVFIQKKFAEEPLLVIYTGGVFQDHYDINDLLNDSCVSDVLGTYYSWKDEIEFFEDLFKKYNVSYDSIPEELKEQIWKDKELSIEDTKSARQRVLDPTGEDVIVEAKPIIKPEPIDITDENITNMIDVFSTQLVTAEEDLITLDIEREDVELIVTALEFYKARRSEYVITWTGKKYILKRNGETIQSFDTLEEFETYADEAKIIDKVKNYP